MMRLDHHYFISQKDDFYAIENISKLGVKWFTLKSRALISQLPDSIEDKINNFFSNCVMTPSIIVGSIFLSSDELFWVEELTVSSSSYLINNSGLKVDENGTRDVLSGTSLREKSIERVVTSTYQDRNYS